MNHQTNGRAADILTNGSGDDPNPWQMWVDCLHVVHDWQIEWYRLWARICLPPLVSPHRHEGHHQLEIPEPLADDTKPELFA